MKLFLIQWGGDEPELLDVAKKLENNGHEILYWNQGVSHLDWLRKDFPKTIFHDWRDALQGIAPKEVDESDFGEPDRAILHSFSSAEPFIFGMITKHHPSFTEAEKREFYRKLLKYWNGLFKKLKPEAVIFPMAPHTAPDFIVYTLAKLAGIMTLMFYATDISDRMLFVEDFVTGSPLLLRTAEAYRGRTFSCMDLSPDLREYYRLHSGGNYIVPLSLRMYKKNFTGRQLLFRRWNIVIKSIKDFSLFEKVFQYIVRHLGDNLRREYRRVATFPDLSVPFVYLPLQYQPEASTNPMGGLFMDQLYMVKVVSEALPKGWFIYVKEHPTQWRRQTNRFSAFRYKGYYKACAELPNVKVVHMHTPTEILTARCMAVVTNTSSAGWESALRLKPTVTFGYPWYRFCPSVFQVNDVVSCKEALATIARGFQPTEQDIINFLVALDHSSIHGYLEGHTKQLSKIAPEEATRNITQVFLEALER